MAFKYRQFRNKVTNEVCFMPAGRYGNFLNSVKKLVNYIRYNIPRYYVLHLTLTVAENTSDVDYKHLHRVIQFIHLRLKRAESDFKYIAVKEVQERGAVHYHILCVYSKPYVFPSRDEVAKSWRLGFIKITAPKIRLRLQGIVGYLGKYIGKGYEYEALDCKKSFTASQIMQIYKLSAHRLAEVVSRYGMSMLSNLTCTFRKVFIEGWKDEEMSICGYTLKTKNRERILLHEFPSQWSYEGMCEEPF